jgi:hypothetical protein
MSLRDFPDGYGTTINAFDCGMKRLPSAYHLRVDANFPHTNIDKAAHVDVRNV